jgi:hypothetical protein
VSSLEALGHLTPSSGTTSKGASPSAEQGTNTRPQRPHDLDGPIYYQGVGTAVGKFRAQRIREGLSSLDQWGRWVEEQAEAFDAASAAFDATLADTKELVAAFERDLKQDAFRKLSRASDTSLPTTVARYGEASSEILAHSKDFQALAWKLAAAEARLARAELRRELQGLQLQLAGELERKAVIEEDLKRIDEFVDKSAGILEKVLSGRLEDAASTIGKGLAWAAGKKLVADVLAGNYRERLAEINEHINAIEDRKKGLANQDIEKELDAASSELKGAKDALEAAHLRLEQAKRAQLDAINHLADLERDNPGTTTLFRKLQAYHARVLVQGEALRQRGREHEGHLHQAGRPLAYTAEVRKAVAQDRSILFERALKGRQSLNDVDTDAAARAILDYTNALEDWHAREIAEIQRLQGALWRHQHLGVTGQFLLRVEREGLKHVHLDDESGR